MTPHPRSENGFTLLELVIAITLLAFLTVFTAQSIQKALQNKTKIQDEIDQLSSIRAALRVMENDIHKAFNHHDINITLHNRAAEERKKQNTQIQNPTPNSNQQGGTPPPPPTTQPTPPADPNAPNPNLLPEIKPRQEIILTHFLGGEDELNFTSLSYQRMSADQRYSDQNEVGYFVKDCRLRSDLSKSAPCLWRRSSPIIDTDPEEGGESTPLLEHVTDLKFRYLSPGLTPEWLSTWFSNKGDDVRSQGQFPLAVEITLEVHDKEGPRSKPVRMTMVAPIRNPNNLPPPQTQDQTNQVQSR